MMATMATAERGRTMLQIEEADAWREYLETCRAAGAARYDEVEPWAWSRLGRRLLKIEQQRARLRAKDAVA